MQNPASLRAALFAAAVLVGAESPAHAFAPVDLYNFGSTLTDVVNPQPFGTMAVDLSGDFFGAAPAGGVNGDGGVFEITPAWVETVPTSFTSTDSPTCQPGLNPAGAGFIGTCYGTPGSGGSLYRAQPYAHIHTFAGAPNDGASPDGPPIRIGSTTTYYGTTAYGGTNNLGTIYKRVGNAVSIVYNFTGGNNGKYPAASFVQEIYPAGGCTATSVCLVGSAEGGGGGGCGTVFQFNPAGPTFTVLHTFVCTDGSNPVAPMIQATNGLLYGTTDTGGANGDGVVFSITPPGTFTLMHSFSAATDGENPQAALVQYGNRLYGTCINGGTAGGWLTLGQGTIFGISAAGVITSLYRFNGSVGSNPAGGLVLSKRNPLYNAYGDTVQGGTHSDGVFYGIRLP